jgi:hypothetical protein
MYVSHGKRSNEAHDIGCEIAASQCSVPGPAQTPSAARQPQHARQAPWRVTDAATIGTSLRRCEWTWVRGRAGTGNGQREPCVVLHPPEIEQVKSHEGSSRHSWGGYTGWYQHGKYV